MSITRTQQRKERSGNALILVVSILVLLVLVATVFITRTQSGRFTAIAQRDSARINERARSIGQSVADELAIALFPRAVLFDGITSVQSANARRIEPFRGALRYGHDSTFSFNFAPYEVIPWTNPPDPPDDVSIEGIPPLGPYNPRGGPSFGDTRWLRDTEPQRADLHDMMLQGLLANGFDGTPDTFTHWRHLTNLSRSGNAWRVVRDISDVFGGGLITDLDVPIEQWPINRPTSIDGFNLAVGSVANDEWPPYPSLDYDGDGFPDGEEHLSRWDEWFTLAGWGHAQSNAKLLPQNFLDLSDLNADGIHNADGERSTDAFIPYTSRWYAELMMTDADGDGFTDSLWHLSPQTLGPDVRQIVAFSVTDNSARGNVNVATRFHRKDFYGPDTATDQQGEATRGHTPADLALVGQNQPNIKPDQEGVDVFPWRVGFMDNFANLPGNSYFQYPAEPLFPIYPEKWVVYPQIGYDSSGNVGYTVSVDWDTLQWDANNGNPNQPLENTASLLDELGIEFNLDNVNSVFNDVAGFLSPTDDITSRYGRLWYWQLAGRDPFEATNGLRPFTIPDELELRIAEGNNYQFVGSRFERSVNKIVSVDYSNSPIYHEVQNQFLRTDFYHAHETSELRDQLDNRQLLFDNRRMLTMFNGVRNDLLPPWLRWEDRFWNRNDPNAIGLPSGYLTFELPEYYLNNLNWELWGSVFPAKVAIEAVFASINSGDENDAFDIADTWREQSRQKVDLREYYSDSYSFVWWESDADGYLNLAERAPLQILLAMTDSQEQGTGQLNANANDAHAPLGVYNWVFDFDDPTQGPDAPWDTVIDPDIGPGDTNFYQQTRLMAAGFASNLLAYRDEDDQWRQHSVSPFHPSGSYKRVSAPLSAAIAPPVLGNQGFDTNALENIPYADVPVEGPNELDIDRDEQFFPSDVMMLGLEAQPFILEAFIAHVHQAKVPGAIGACCIATGGCEDVSEETCIGLLGGTFSPSPDVCDADGDGVPEHCGDQGACCVGTGGCLYTSQISCEGVYGGEYMGDGIACSAATCSGACCTYNGDCEDMSAFSCGQVGGAFAGNDTSCETTTCVLLGGCCLGSGTCMNVISLNACESLGGTFKFDKKCSASPCAVACCVDFADCIEITEGGCIEINGIFDFDVTCTSSTCDVAGACCLGSDSCNEVQSIDECIVLDGEFLTGLCIDTPCIGSCCLGGGECQEISIGVCNALGGEFVQSATCDTSPCRSACCFSTGGCANLLLENCIAFNGTNIGDGIFCDSAPCVEGACCLSFDDSLAGGNNDGCIEVTNGGCDVLGGVFQGDGISCGSIPCGVSEDKGACCLPTGLCQDVVSEDVCDALAGVWKGDGPIGEDVSCAESPCIPSGGCCIENATCIDLLEELCDDLGGFWADVSCAQTPCASACCLPDGSCEDKLESECIIAGGVFNDQQTCLPSNPCVTVGACCSGGDSCDVVTPLECASFGGIFNGAVDCTTDPCGLGELGACCMNPLGCIVVVLVACDDIDGTWSAGACDSNACNLGACCLEDGDSAHCLEVISSSACDTLGGAFHDGEDCSERPCIGACCLWGGGCELLSQNTCDNLKDPDGDGNWDEDDPPGFYNGVGTTCSVNTCPPVGSCCLQSDTCVDIFGVRDFVDYCQLVLGGTYRPNEFCADTECGGACCLGSGGCENLPEVTCDAIGGAFQGTGVFCDTDPCGNVGACCFDSGSCIETPADSCTLLGGVAQPGQTCKQVDCLASFLVTDNRNDCPQETVAVVQLANPFDRAIDLNQYSVEFFGQEFKFADYHSTVDLVLPPSTPTNPSTVILYAMPEGDADIVDPDLVSQSPHLFNTDWINFLDIEVADHPVDDPDTVQNPATLAGYEATIIIPVPNSKWSTDRDYYDNLNRGDQNSVALYKFDEDLINVPPLPTQRVLIDRLDPPQSSVNFEQRIVDELETEWNKVGSVGYIALLDSNEEPIEANASQSALYVQWDRATRAWGTDIPLDGGWHNDVIDALEHNPRYIFAGRDFIRSEQIMTVVNSTASVGGTTNTLSDIFYSSAFHWTEFDSPDDFDGDGNDDNASSSDDDLLADDPDPWFMVEVWSPRAGEFRPGTSTEGEVKGGLRFRKPTYFDMNHKEDPAYTDSNPDNPYLEPWSYLDKGWYGQRDDADGDETTSDTPAFNDLDASDSIGNNEVDMAMAFPLQMLQKDEDFEQVGELLNVWLFGHMLEGDYYPPTPEEVDAGVEADYEYLLELPPTTMGEFVPPVDSPFRVDAGTITTFSEFMYPRWGNPPLKKDWWAPWVALVNDKVVLDARVNRLRFIPRGDDSLPLMMDGRSQSDPLNGMVDATNHAWPRLSIASRILDSFVCDGPGRPDYISGDGIGDDLNESGSGYALPSVHSFYNANGFTGKSTPGIININTAPVEVLRMLPHMYKVVHSTHEEDPWVNDYDRNPRSLIPESIVQWREGADGLADIDMLTGTGFTGGPDYSNRTRTLGLQPGDGPKETRGFSSPSEIGLLRPNDGWGVLIDDVWEPWHISGRHQAIRDVNSWRIDFAAAEPFFGQTGLGDEFWVEASEPNNNVFDPGIENPFEHTVGGHISTDVNFRNYYGQHHRLSGDGVSGDAEEINLLQAGISNLISTTSDMFTVHMRIRTFRRNPITGVWNATDPDFIIDDSRYVLLVDRSNVNAPADKPRILYFEKLPN